jgi:2-polyprenyl-6-methoxyphenol hydroxylase-like FAD-dependent oxidoreductase
MASQEVLVVGAGPTGLLMALSLASRGIPVRIVEKRERPTDQSRAIVVQARTIELYAQLGV